MQDLFVYNANILPTGDQSSQFDAMTVRNGRVSALGKFSALKNQGPYSEEIDIQGRVILPGFFDSHTHLCSNSCRGAGVKLDECKSLNQVIGIIREHLNLLNEGEWVLGMGWDESRWEDGEKRYILAKDLDTITTDHPVILWREDGHLISVNSTALPLIQSMVIKNASGIEKDDSGTPTGILKDVELDLKKLLPPTPKMLDLLQDTCRNANSLGITSVVDQLASWGLPYYQALERSGRLTVRVRFNLEWDRCLKSITHLGMQTGLGSDMLRFGGLKLFTDGSIGAQTALFKEKFSDTGEPGLELLNSEDLAYIYRSAAENGLRVAGHAIGDQSIETLIEIIQNFENEAKEESYWDTHFQFQGKHTIEHAEGITDSQISQLREMSVVLSMQPNFLKWQEPGGLYETRLGSNYSNLNPFRPILEAGIPLAFGSDCMPLGPFYGMHWAVNFPDERQRISLEEAIRAYTLGGAIMVGEEAHLGSLEVGKYADFIVCTDNPYEVEPAELKDIVVHRTFVEGKEVYSLE